MFQLLTCSVNLLLTKEASTERTSWWLSGGREDDGGGGMGVGRSGVD